MGERTTGTLPEDNRQTGALASDRQTGTLASDRQTGTLPIDRQTGTLPIDNQSNRMTSTLQDDINSNKNYYNNDENQYIYNDFTDFGYDYEIHPAYRWALQPDSIQNLFDQIELMDDPDCV